MPSMVMQMEYQQLCFSFTLHSTLLLLVMVLPMLVVLLFCQLAESTLDTVHSQTLKVHAIAAAL
jgi:hypothetical protein